MKAGTSNLTYPSGADEIITIQVLHECQGSKIRATPKAYTYKFGQTEPQVIEGKIRDDFSISNSIADQHMNRLFCGSYEYMAPNHLPPSIKFNKDTGEFAISSNGPNYNVFEFDIIVMLESYTQVQLTTKFKVIYVCELDSIYITMTTSAYAYFINSKKTEYPVVVTYTTACSYSQIKTEITCKKKPDQQFLKSVDGSSNFSIKSSDPNDVGLYIIQYRVFWDNQWGMALPAFSADYSFTVDIQHDCMQTKLEDYTAPLLVYYMEDEAAALTMSITNEVARLRGPNDSLYCGPTDLIQTSPRYSFLQSMGNILSVYSTNASDIGVYQVTFQARLPNFNIERANYVMNVDIRPKAQCPELKPQYTDGTVFQTNYQIRGPTQILQMPQYTWRPSNCPYSLKYRLINISVGWPEDQLPDFMKPNVEKGFVTMDGKLLIEANKRYRFRLIATCIQKSWTSQDYEFTVATSIFSSAPFFAPQIPNVIIPKGQDYTWTLPKIQDKEGDTITSVQVQLGEYSDWLKFKEQSMTFKAVGLKTQNLQTGNLYVKVILQDQYGSESIFIQGIFLDNVSNATDTIAYQSQGIVNVTQFIEIPTIILANSTKAIFSPQQTIANSTDAIGSLQDTIQAKNNQTSKLNTTDYAVFCLNTTSNSTKNCTKNQAETQQDPQISSPKKSGDYLVVPRGNKTQNKDATSQDLNQQSQLVDAFDAKAQPQKLQISMKKFEFGCGLEIEFSEPIDTTQPDFQMTLQELFRVTILEKTPQADRRELKVKFKPGKFFQTNNNEQDLTDYDDEYQLSTSIDESGRKIKYSIKFKEPLNVSIGTRIHYLAVQPQNLSMLRGLNGPLVVPNVLPTKFQLSAQTKSDEVESIAQVTKTVSHAARVKIIATLIASFLLGTSLSAVWSMVGSLQNIALMAFLNVQYPGNANSFIFRIFWISSFDVIPEKMITWWAEIWTKFSKHPVEDEIINERFSQRIFQMGMTNTNPMFNLQQSGLFIVLLAAQICIVVTLPILLKRCTNPQIAKLVGLCEKQKEVLLWNSTLRLFIELYFDIAMAGLIRINTNEWDQKYERAMTTLGWVLLFFILAFPILLFAIIYRYRILIQTEDFKARYGQITEGLDATSGKYFYFWCFFIVQRLMECLIIVQFQQYQVFQIQGFFFITVAQIIYVGWQRPFEDRQVNQLELINSMVVLLSCYWLLFFTDFLPNNQVRYNSAWILIALISLNIACNIAFSICQNYGKVVQRIKQTYLRIKNRHRLGQQQKVKIDVMIVSEQMPIKANDRIPEFQLSQIPQESLLVPLSALDADQVRSQLDQIQEISQNLEESESEYDDESGEDQEQSEKILLPSDDALTPAHDIESLKADIREQAEQIVQTMMKPIPKRDQNALDLESGLGDIDH